MKRDWKYLLICLAIPLGVGGLAALLTGGSMKDYASFVQPPLSPPGWVFPVVWTVLYLLMGYCSYLVATAEASPIEKFRALSVYGLQLVVNFIWPLVFFRAQLFLAALFVLLALWLLVFLTMRLFSAIDTRAGTLMLPYLLWVTFAGYLNYGVWRLN